MKGGRKLQEQMDKITPHITYGEASPQQLIQFLIYLFITFPPLVSLMLSSPTHSYTKLTDFFFFILTLSVHSYCGCLKMYRLQRGSLMSHSPESFWDYVNAAPFAEETWCCLGDINNERCLLKLGFGCREMQVDLFRECVTVNGVGRIVFPHLLAVVREEVCRSRCSI